MRNKQWHLVVSASKGYEFGLKALLNSFYYYHRNEIGTDKIKIHVLGLDLSSTFSHEINYFHKLERHEKGNAWATKIPRFKYASELNGVVMLLDADMYFTANWNIYFQMAEAGFIVAGANGSNFMFHQGWREKYGIKEIPDFYDTKTISSVPTILDTEKHGEVWRSIYEHKMNGNGIGADFDLTNIFMLIHKKFRDIVVLPSQQVTGLHHFMLKPDTRVIKKHGELITTDGLQVLSVHGKWWQSNYIEGIMRPVERQYGNNPRAMKGALESRNLLIETFEYWKNYK